MDTYLEVVVIPVSGVEREKVFYARLGWRLDADVSGDEYRQRITPRCVQVPRGWGQILTCIRESGL